MNDTGALKLTTAGDREIVLTRVFDAPRAQVFKALTTPELLERWFGPRVWSLAVCDVDLKVGGVYREIAAPDRLVHTEAFDDWFKGESVVTTVLTERDGKTTFTGTVRYPTPEIRDEVVKSNMEQGVAESYDRLAELLASR